MSSTGRGSRRNYFQQARPKFGTLAIALVPILAAIALSVPFALGTDVTPTASESGDVWVADHRTASRIDAATNQITHRIPLPHEATALAVDPRDQALWVLTHKQLLKFDADTSLLFEVDLKALVKKLSDPESLILNPYNGDVWVSAKKTLLRLDNQGRLVLAVRFPDKIEAAALNLDESLWLLTKKELRQVSAQGETRAAVVLKNLGLKDAEHLAIDSLGGRLWIADEERLWQLTTADLTAPPTRVALPPKAEEIEAIALDPLSGALWVGTEEQLIAFNRTGTQQLTVDLDALKLDEPEVLAVDALRQHLWVGAKKKVAKFAFSGELLATVPVEKKLEALALAPVAVFPQIALIQPAADARTNNPKPTFRLALSARCNEVACEAGEGYLQGFLFNATLNGEAVGDRFAISDTEALFTPATRLPEGLNSFTATATDTFGHASNTVSAQFTIDTIAPVFLDLTPADGFVTRQAAQTISGTLSESALVTINGTPELTDSNNVFNRSVTLTEGKNTFTIVAQDTAGNIAQRVLNLFLDTIPPAPANASLIAFGTVDNGEATLSGGADSVESGATVTVTNSRSLGVVSALADAGGSFTLTIGAQAGDSLSLVVLDQAGNNSAAIELLVPGDTGGGELPPDPVTVAPALDRTVATSLFDVTSFLYSGSNPIQTGVAEGTIEARRVAVLRGTVKTRDGATLSGVKVSVLNHPELGQTLTRADGMFDLAVNGGGALTLDYSKENFLPSQRTLSTPWRDYVFAPDVVLVPLDPQVTTVDLTAPVIQVARGSTSTDEDGTRQATLLFAPGTTATMVLADGTTQPLTTINVRATEYTIGPSGPEAMPAPLPPTSGYTYAVELSVDEAIAVGAREVTFNQPVIQYVENFLAFPVGEIVPVGYYDRAAATWIPSNNGRVIKILSTSSGLAEIDINGNGASNTTAQLAALGITDAERVQLASLYPANTSLWRVPITHFTPWDSNWPYDFPGGARGPGQPDPEEDEKEPDGCEQKNFSIIECQNQVLGERVSIVGTPFTLNYRSDRVPGRTGANTLTIPLSGAEVPTSLRRIELVIDIAGQHIVNRFPAAPNQSFQFKWDGKDAYGRAINGQQTANIQLGYVYGLVYRLASGSGNSFGSGSGGVIVGVNRPSLEATLSQTWQANIGAWDARGQVGGWSISAQHAYDMVGQTLYLGDGNRRDNTGAHQNTVITTIVDGRSSPFATAVGPDGSVYFANLSSHDIERVTPDGRVTTVARNLGQPVGITVGSDGSIYMAEFLIHRVRRLAPNGVITTIAGTGVRGFSGDGGPATQATLSSPFDVALGPDGSVYISDRGNDRIRRVAPDGRISTFAGTGLCCFSGDGGPATQANISSPDGLAVGPDGSLYIAQGFNFRVRRVSRNGIITTFAGNGANNFSGDGGPATQAGIGRSGDVAVGPDGSLFVADSLTNRIRRILPNGIIVTIAGNGFAGFSGDGGPGTAATLNAPNGVAVGPDGSVYIADRLNRRIRKVAPLLPSFAATDLFIASDADQALYRFTVDGRHLATLNRFTGATVHTFGYTSDGFLASITDGDGNVTTIEREDSGEPIAIVAPDGQRTTLALDPNGYLAAVTNPAGESHALTYTVEGLLTSFTNPRGHTSQFTYDADGRLIKDENAAAGFLSLSRTVLPDGYEVNERSVLDRTRTYRVDKLPTGDRQWVNTGQDGTQTQTVFRTNGATATTAPDGTITTVIEGPDPRFGMQAPITKSLTTKLPSGLTAQISGTRSVSLLDPNDRLSLATQTDTVTSNGKTSTNVYNAVARLHTFTTTAGRTIRTATDLQGRPTQVTVGSLAPVSYAYDARGRLATVSQGSGTDTRNMSFAYDAQGNVASITDPANRTQTFTYDPAGRVKTQTLPDGTVIQLSYDANDNITTIIPPGRPAHSFQYTSVDLEEQYTPPELTEIPDPSTRYEYDLDKQLTNIIRPDGQSVTLGYDAAGRLASMAPSTALGGATINYAYHPTKGFLESITTTDAETLMYTNDGFLLTGESWGGSVAGQVTRAYNSDFQVSGLGVNGTTIPFGYDNDGLLTQAGNFLLTRDPQHGLVTASALGSVTTSQAYNSFGELGQFTASFGSTGSYDVQFTRDALDRITQKTETLPGELASTFTYGYDLAGRLTAVTKDGTTVAQYAYDLNGNRLSKTTPSGTVTGTYDEQDRLLTYGNNTYTYTANGELRTKAISGQPQSTSYDYDVFGNLKHVTLSDGINIDYVLDGRNRRIGKRINGQLSQGLLYQDQLNPIAELDGAGNVITRFVYGSRPNVPDYLVKGGQNYRIIADHLGSPRLVINTQTGVVEQRLDYNEFGNITFDSNPGFQPFGFAGGIYDAHTKLIRFGARDYDPETGRWTAKDPNDFNGRDTNLYGYVLNDPINLIDPTGKILWMLAGAAVSAGLDLAFQLWQNEGKLDCVNWGEVAVAGVLGGLGGQVGFWAKIGKEFKVGKNFRIAPFGNRTGHPTGRYPHYHRRGERGPDGNPLPGEGMGRHRPWDPPAPGLPWWSRF